MGRGENWERGACEGKEYKISSQWNLCPHTPALATLQLLCPKAHSWHPGSAAFPVICLPTVSGEAKGAKALSSSPKSALSDVG